LPFPDPSGSILVASLVDDNPAKMKIPDGAVFLLAGKLGLLEEGRGG
jgi:hypothetical protein